jgi:trehalose/maltose hydrolase-like predicted phosphorylase
MNEWQLTYTEYQPRQQPLREALCTLGNGYIAVRGAHESSRAGAAHYPGFYLAGGYNRMKSEVAGKVIENEDLVNWPNWLFMTFRAENGDWFSLDTVTILDFNQTLDLAAGELRMRIVFKDAEGRVTELASRRLVHMANAHLCGIQWRLTPQNWSGAIELHAALDGAVNNSGVDRYSDLNGDHLETLRSGRATEDTVYLEVQTRQSHIRMAQAQRLRAYNDGKRLPVQRSLIQHADSIGQQLSFTVARHESVRIEKIASVFTIRDFAISEPVVEACEHIGKAPSFEDLAASQKKRWSTIWRQTDLCVQGVNHTQMLLHLHAFHLMQTTSTNSLDLDIGIPPRGWHGEAYRAHIMWDELFVFPFLSFRNPVLARDLLMYRYRRLDRARWAARDNGYRGAMFPWQSGSDGREESQRIHLNPQSGRWIPDNTDLQRHVNSAIAYSVWHYYQITGDKEFLYFFGAELIVEIARLWVSMAQYDPRRERFVIRNIIGPDEYHTRYPGADSPGVHNNAYTNIMASWVIARALDILNTLDMYRREQLLASLEIDIEELDRWDHISRRLFVPFFDNGVIEQFEGYRSLNELDWSEYRRRHGDNMRLDRILEAENDSVNNYKASKQADVLMVLYLFSSDELRQTLARMDYRFDPDAIPKTIDYYQSRTSHGSTLSRLVFSWILSRSDRKRSWRAFEKALVSDFEDVQGGTTPEGIHLGAMAGTLDIIQRCYTGMEVQHDLLRFNPCIPDEVSCVRFNIRYRSHWLRITVDHTSITVSAEEGWGNPVKIGVGDQQHTIHHQETRTFDL